MFLPRVSLQLRSESLLEAHSAFFDAKTCRQRKWCLRGSRSRMHSAACVAPVVYKPSHKTGGKCVERFNRGQWLPWVV